MMCENFPTASLVFLSCDDNMSSLPGLAVEGDVITVDCLDPLFKRDGSYINRARFILEMGLARCNNKPSLSNTSLVRHNYCNHKSKHWFMSAEGDPNYMIKSQRADWQNGQRHMNYTCDAGKHRREDLKGDFMKQPRGQKTPCVKES